ncbi:hypothetical protein PM082_015662 [Marasmius tenuissimus]|nr:hypothetical protein PM082_015662 [Marasmius tenuissimus]
MQVARFAWANLTQLRKLAVRTDSQDRQGQIKDNLSVNAYSMQAHRYAVYSCAEWFMTTRYINRCIRPHLCFSL